MTGDGNTLRRDRGIKGKGDCRLWLESVRYVIVGGLSFLIYFGLLGLFFSLLHTRYPVAVSIAYAFAVALHFLANRTFTFDAAGAPVAAQFGRYAGMVLLNYGIQIFVLYVVYDLCGLNFYLGAVSGVLATLVTGFFLMRTWVFAREKRKSQRRIAQESLPDADCT
jgi:putative flippase GtrA